MTANIGVLIAARLPTADADQPVVRSGRPAASWENPDLSVLNARRRAAPDFDIDVLGPDFAEWAVLQADSISAPVDYVAVSLLANAAATIANVRWPLAGATWCEPPLLWVGLVGRPSSGKSPAVAAAQELVREAE